MLRTVVCGLMAALTITWAGFADDVSIGRGIGQPVADVTLKDTAGKEVRLRDLQGKKALVTVFVAPGCPVADLYLPRLGELAKAYEEKDVLFVAIAAGRGEDAKEVGKHLKRHGAAIPVLMDQGNVAADLLLAERTCEALVIDKDHRLRYRGAIDDQYTPKARKERPTRKFLCDALDAVLAGKEVAVKATPVAGCPIERAETSAPPVKRPVVRPAPRELVDAIKATEKAVEIGRVSYASDVAPILQDKCQSCHRPKEVAPFSLLSYDDARRRYAAIREAVADRRMPPWHAEPRFGKFADDRSLSTRQRATLLAWIDQGCPLGDPKDLPPPRKFTEGWAIGAPDVVIEMPEPFIVPAQGTLPYQHFRVKTNFKKDTWIQATEVRPGERSVLHHLTVTVVSPKDSPLGALLKGPDQDQFLASYTPGSAFRIYPEGTGKLVPAASDLIFEVHYTPTGRIKADRSKLGLILCKEPPRRRVAMVSVCSLTIAIPPGDANYKAESSYTFRSDATLLALKPHMHLRGKDFKFTATYPDGKTEVLLSVPAYDFGWQSNFELAKPKSMPKGARIDCLAHFDNSANNPFNPDPKKTVRFGLQTYDEMMCGVLEIIFDLPQQAKERATADSPAGGRR